MTLLQARLTMNDEFIPSLIERRYMGSQEMTQYHPGPEGSPRASKFTGTCSPSMPLPSDGIQSACERRACVSGERSSASSANESIWV